VGLAVVLPVGLGISHQLIFFLLIYSSIFFHANSSSALTLHLFSFAVAVSTWLRIPPPPTAPPARTTQVVPFVAPKSLPDCPVFCTFR